MVFAVLRRVDARQADRAAVAAGAQGQAAPRGAIDGVAESAELGLLGPNASLQIQTRWGFIPVSPFGRGA